MINTPPARAWSEKVTLPTYPVGAPNPNPMFLDKRVYQGSSGVVYPHPVIDEVADQPEAKEWTAVFLENQYIELMLLPELGGRLHRAIDKSNGVPFFYHNQVIKPALVGLTGPWISGGIEFNWPQHHRPSTYSAVNWEIEEHADGAVTVWCSEDEKMFRQRGRHGFRLEPGRAAFDVVVRLSNPGEQAQTFLWWANPAVPVHDHYQSVFPPDVHAVMDHGKRDVSNFPIATGVYYKQNYAPGTDISRYKNIPVPTSYMAYHSDYDFVGCYDHAQQTGMLHVANHHLVPGKKQWTWGHGAFGRAWDRQLTEVDGPYIELMCGAFTDNQPDFTWLMPGEEKRFTQTFLPYKEIGPAVNASRDWVLRLDKGDSDTVGLGVYAVADGEIYLELWHTPTPPVERHNAKNMRLPALERPVDGAARLGFECPLQLSAAESWQQQITLPEDFHREELTCRLLSADRKKVLLSFSVPSTEKPEIPSPATPPPPPSEVPSNEALYLHGLHLEQYRHATYAPEPYYQEALKRDPGDSRCRIALGRLLLSRGDFKAAEKEFRLAVERLTFRNPNPADGEVFYQLGLSLRYQERWDEAFDCFYKATWSEAWKSPAFFELARIAAMQGNHTEALELVEESLVRNSRHAQAQSLKKLLSDNANQPEAELPPYQALLQGLEGVHAGFTDRADQMFLQAQPSEFMALYFRAWNQWRAGNKEVAKEFFVQAAAQPMDFAFPNLLESVPALQTALEVNPDDALACYALGNFFYAHKRPMEAIHLWEYCTRLQPNFPTAWRNLGLARMNRMQDAAGAGVALENAFRANPLDARVLYELDQLGKETGMDPQLRLNRLDAHREQTLSRDDLCVEYLHLLNLSGRESEALEIVKTRTFHPWEGGEGKVPAQFRRSLFKLAAAHPKDALQLVDQALNWPDNLGEGMLPGAVDNEALLLRGHALRSSNRDEDAKMAFQFATEGIQEPAGAMYYNDQPPENIYFQGLAWQELGEPEKARQRFQSLVDYADIHEQDEITMDYFAVSLPDFLVFDVDLTERNRRHCLFMRALGCTGLGKNAEAKLATDTLLAVAPDHPVRHLLG